MEIDRQEMAEAFERRMLERANRLDPDAAECLKVAADVKAEVARESE